MIPTWTDIDAAQERCEDLVREAERERRVAAVEALLPRTRVTLAERCCGALAVIGHLMVAWGRRLEALAPGAAGR